MSCTPRCPSRPLQRRDINTYNHVTCYSAAYQIKVQSVRIIIKIHHIHMQGSKAEKDWLLAELCVCVLLEIKMCCVLRTTAGCVRNLVVAHKTTMFACRSKLAVHVVLRHVAWCHQPQLPFLIQKLFYRQNCCCAGRCLSPPWWGVLSMAMGTCFGWMVLWKSCHFETLQDDCVVYNTQI